MTTYESAKYDYSGENITAIPTSAVSSGKFANARISGNSVTQHVAAFTDTNIRNDIGIQALHSAVADDAVAFNLPNAFIEQFQDDSGLDNQTNVDRNATEYMSSILPNPPTAAYSSDSDTLLLLHGDGSNGGTTFSDSGNTNHGNATVIGNTHTDTSVKKFGTASMQFDGSGDSLTFADHADWTADNTWTLDVWVYITDLSHQNYIFALGDGSTSNQQYCAIGTDGSMKWQQYSSSAYQWNLYTAAGTVTANSWQHLAWVRGGDSAGDWKFYHNGIVKDKTLQAGSYGGTPKNFASVLNIGNDTYSAYDYHFEGYMDEYRVSDVARSFISDNATGSFTCNNQTANSTISKGGIIVLYENKTGTNTLNTDLIAKISANGGTNYETVTLSALGTFDTGVLMAGAQNVTISNTGTAMKYQIAFANQSLASKECRVHGVALMY